MPAMSGSLCESYRILSLGFNLSDFLILRNLGNFFGPLPPIHARVASPPLPVSSLVRT